MNRIAVLYVLCCIQLSCVHNAPHQSNKNPEGSELVKYAKGFSVKKMDDGYIVQIFHPTNKTVTYQTIAIGNVDESIVKQKFDFKVVKTCSRIVSQSTTNIAMLTAIGNDSLLLAASNARYIYDSTLQQRLQAGLLTDLGSHEIVALEALIALHPDILCKYLYAGDNVSDAGVVQAGIPIVYITDYLETHPLGRAEWIKLMGLLTDEYTKADSVFTNIEEKYLAYQKLAAEVASRPSAMVGNSFKGTWYTPGGQSFLAYILRDAGADYYWKSDSSTGSLPLSIESIVENQARSDYWVNANALSVDELLQMDERNAIFKAVQEKQVYNYDNRVNAFGGNDYFESAVVHPEVLLADFIQIFHPQLVDTNRSLYYLRKLN